MYLNVHIRYVTFPLFPPKAIDVQLMRVTQSAFCPQRVSLHTFFQVCGQGFGHSVPYCEGESQAVEALDLPAPTCFRSRSHSYLRAIQAGCSQDDDTASVDSESPPPTTKGYSYSSNTRECQLDEGWAESLYVVVDSTKRQLKKKASFLT